MKTTDFSFVLKQQYTKYTTIITITIHQNAAVSNKHYWENFKIIDHKYRFWILKIIVFLATTKNKKSTNYKK